MSIRAVMIAGIFAAGTILTMPAQAQTSPGLTSCLKAHTSKEDRTILMRWIFAGMARGAMVRDMSKMTEEQHGEAMRKAGQVINRLLTNDCRADALTAMKAGGPAGMQNAFGELGRTATMDLMADPEVMGTFAGIVQYVDMAALAKMLMDSGAFHLPK